MTRDPHRSGENFGRSQALFGMRREAHGRKSLRFTRAAVALRSVCLNSKVRLPSFVLIGGHPIARTAVMVRIVVMSVLAALLAACSGSSRVEDIVPAWANTPPHPATQYSARKTQVQGRGPLAAEQRAPPAAEPQQEPKKPEAANPSQE
jgi:hypothetical protein